MWKLVQMQVSSYKQEACAFGYVFVNFHNVQSKVKARDKSKQETSQSKKQDQVPGSAGAASGSSACGGSTRGALKPAPGTEK